MTWDPKHPQEHKGERYLYGRFRVLRTGRRWTVWQLDDDGYVRPSITLRYWTLLNACKTAQALMLVEHSTRRSMETQARSKVRVMPRGASFDAANPLPRAAPNEQTKDQVAPVDPGTPVITEQDHKPGG